MNLDHDFFQVSKLSEDQKKRSSSKERKLCSPNSSGDVRSNAHQSQIIGGCRCRLYSIYRGRYSQIGGIYLPIPPLGFGSPVGEKMKQRQTKVEETDLLETIIRVEAQNKALRPTLPLRSRLMPMVLVQAQG